MERNYEMLREAILGKQTMVGMYQERERRFAPHAIGLGKDGFPRVLVYQYGGESSKGLAADLPERDKWRCLVVTDLSDLALDDHEWATAENHSEPSTCIKELDVEVEY